MKSRIFQLLFGFRNTNVDVDLNDTLSGMYKRLLDVAWPAALEGVLLSLMNSFDTMMVGKIGAAAITSVGLCSQPRMIMLVLAQALCVGTTAIVARRKGEERQDKAVSCLKQSLVIITVIGILITLIGTCFSKQFVELAGANSETVGDATIYFRIISYAFIANCWSLCICAAFRGISETRITMVVNMTANIVNVMLNYCLINGNFGFPALGVRGAAIATAIGTCVGCIMAIIQVLRPHRYLSLLHTGWVKFDKETVSSLISVGSGSIAESVFMRIGFLVNGRLIAGIGTAAYACNSIVQQVTSLTFCLGDGFASACTSLIGQSLGAKKKEKAKLYVKVVSRISLFMSIGLMIFTFFGRRFLPTLFTTDEQIISMASIAFIVVLFGIYAQNARVIYAGCLRGAGDVKYVAFVSLVSVAILRPGLTYLFAYPLNSVFPMFYLGFTGPWLSFVFDAYVRMGLLKYRINQGKWVNIRI